MAQNPDSRWLGIITAVICIGLSGWTMWLAQKDIPWAPFMRYGQAWALLVRFLSGWFFYGEAARLSSNGKAFTPFLVSKSGQRSLPEGTM